MQISKTEQKRLYSLSTFENLRKAQGYLRIAGVDEAGRGPLAGPVVAGACILPEGKVIQHLNDSKQLSHEMREKLYEEITQCAIYGIGIVDVETIDRINILQATFLAMQKAVEAMPQKPDFLLIDGNRSPKFSIPTETIIEGDAKSVSIAAASILAKVTRDRLMRELDAIYPIYNFKQHKGYGTEEHMRLIREYGPCPIHRKSFNPVSQLEFF